MPDIAGVWSTSLTSTLTYDEWWLIDLVNDSLNYMPNFYGPVLRRDQKEEQAVFNPLGREFSVVLRGVIRGERLELPFEAVTQAEFDAYNNIRAVQRTLLLKRGYTGEQWYISLGAERPVEEAGYDDEYRRWVVEATEVDVP